MASSQQELPPWSYSTLQGKPQILHSENEKTPALSHTNDEHSECFDKSLVYAILRIILINAEEGMREKLSVCESDVFQLLFVPLLAKNKTGLSDRQIIDNFSLVNAISSWLTL